ncbi:hypothetical protein [Aeromonas veronii]|uniref:hypothetical protein n=1 Tax=Aeromonas veronii TaxID=654 RepID=UPI0038E81B09
MSSGSVISPKGEIIASLLLLINPSLGSLVLSPYFLVEQGIDGLVFYCAAHVGGTMMFKFLMFLYGFAIWLTDRGEGDQ